jgi:hypothetical protein
MKSANVWLSLLLALLIVSALTIGCGGGYTPPAPCSPALNCVDPPITYQSSLCPPAPGYVNGMVETNNAHPSRNLYATFTQVVVHLNQPGVPDTTSYLTRYMPVNTTVNLGCHYVVRAADVVDQYFFTPISACFEGDASCTGPTEIASRPPNVDCFKSPDYCVTFDLTGLTGANATAATAAAKSVLQLIRNKPPLTTAFISGLPLANCKRNDGTVSAGGQFREDGMVCRQGYLVQNNSAKAVVFTVPAIISGTFAQVLGTGAVITLPDPNESPVLEWFDNNDKSMGIEHIASVDLATDSAGRPQVRILGDRRYCLVLKLPNP